MIETAAWFLVAYAAVELLALVRAANERQGGTALVNAACAMANLYVALSLFGVIN
jgi:hypothetical protein